MWEQVDISLAKMRNRDASNTSGVLVNLALFPESREWAEKKEPGAHCLLILISLRISGNLKISVKSAPLHQLP